MANLYIIISIFTVISSILAIFLYLEKQKNKILNSIILEKEQLNKEIQNENSDLKNKIISKEEKINFLEEIKTKEISILKEQISELKNSKDTIKNEFKVLAEEVLAEKNKKINEEQKDSLNSILEPIRQSLNSFRDRVETVHKEDIEGRAGLAEQLKIIKDLNSQMTSDAKELTKALKGDTKVQGNWGEMILEKLLDSTGLKEGREYFREKSYNEEGNHLRPDVILNMPNNKSVVIDSKVSLVNYEKAINTENKEEFDKNIKGHLNSLKKHIDTLAEKRYDNLEGVNSLDFTLMFIPIEGAYLLAIENEPNLFEKAFEKRIAVVTPTTLFTTLKTIEQLWRYEKQTKNSALLIRKAADVHDKMVGFLEGFEKLGKQLDLLNKTYDDNYNKLRMGKGNLIRQTEMLKEVAGKTKKELPSHILEMTEGDKILD